MTLTQNPETSRLLSDLVYKYEREFGEKEMDALMKNLQKFERFEELPQKQQDQLNYIRKIVGV